MKSRRLVVFSLCGDLSPLDSNHLYGQDGGSSDLDINTNKGPQPTKRRKTNVPRAPTTTEATSTAFKFLIDVASMRPPGQKHWTRCAQNNPDLVNQTSNWPFLPSAIPYELLDQAEEDAGFPQSGYIYPISPSQKAPENNNKGAIIAPRWSSLPPRTGPSGFETAPLRPRAGSLTLPYEAVIECARRQFRHKFPPRSSPITSAPPQNPHNEETSTIAQVPRSKPSPKRKPPTKVQKPRSGPPAKLELIGPPVPPPRVSRKKKKKKKKKPNKKSPPPRRLIAAGIPLEDLTEDLLPHVFAKRRRCLVKS